MVIEKTDFEGLLLIKARRFSDLRGSFYELFQQQRYVDAGVQEAFVQDNVSVSTQGTLRGLHYQWGNPQAKLVTVLWGSIFDVAVDLRESSPTFGRTFTRTLDGDAKDEVEQIKIPVGFAHGFCVVSESAAIHYKCSDVYTPSAERTIAWNDPDLAIEWPVESPVISEKDACGIRFCDADYFG